MKLQDEQNEIAYLAIGIGIFFTVAGLVIDAEAFVSGLVNPGIATFVIMAAENAFNFATESTTNLAITLIVLAATVGSMIVVIIENRTTRARIEAARDNF